MTLMFATELVTLGRIIAGCRPVAHCGQFRCGEQLELPHTLLSRSRAYSHQ